MKKKTLLLCLCTFLFGLFAVSCDDNADDPKYRSLPPRFEEMTFKMLKDGSTTVKAGEKCVATCVQSKPGRLLDHTTYEWQATNRKDLTHQYKKVLKAGYDNEREHPTDTIVFENPGTYQIVFKARYTTSGNSQIVSEIQPTKDKKGKITYKTPSFQFYDVTIEKSVTVE